MPRETFAETVIDSTALVISDVKTTAIDASIREVCRIPGGHRSASFSRGRINCRISIRRQFPETPGDLNRA